MSATSDHSLQPADVLKALEILLTPVGGDGDKSSGVITAETVNETLKRNLDILDRHLSRCGSSVLKNALTEEEKKLQTQNIVSTTEWTFVSTLLQLLHLVAVSVKESVEVSQQSSPQHVSEGMQKLNLKPKRPQDAPPLSCTALSVAQEKTVRNALQFVIRLGVCPNLNRGVGIPLQHRSSLPAALNVGALAADADREEPRRLKLSLCMSVLASFLDVKDLGVFILNLHLNDLLAGLLQLSCAYSTSTPGTEEMLLAMNERKADMVQVDTGNGKHAELPTDTGHFKKILEKVISEANPDLVIRELMVLQTGIPQKVQAARKESSKESPHSTVQPPPAWLRKACNQILQKVFCRPQGILHLYAAMTVGVPKNSPAHWKCCDAVARVVSRCPVSSLQLDQYVGHISEQLLRMLHTKDGPDKPFILRLVATVVNEMAAVHKDNFSQQFFQPLMRPLTLCVEDCDGLQEGQVVVEEDALNTCLDGMYKVLVVNQRPQASVVSALQPVIGVLWVLSVLTHNTVYNIRTAVRELLVKYLKSLGSAEAAVCLRQLAGVTESECDPVGEKLTVCFQSGNAGGLKAVYSGDENASKLDEKDQVASVVDILGELKADGVAGELLVLLLKELTEMLSPVAHPSEVVLPFRVERSEVREQKVQDFRRKVTVLHLLASICETFGSECLTDTRHILLFVKVSLERGVAVCQNTAEEETALFETETMSMAMGLLTTVLAGAIQMNEDDRSMMDTMLPLLSSIGEDHPDEFIREMASDIRIAIATRGAVWSSLQEGSIQRRKQKASSEKKTEEIKVSGQKEPSARPLIEVLSDIPASAANTVQANTAQSESSSPVQKDFMPSTASLSSAQTGSSHPNMDKFSDSLESSSRTKQPAEVKPAETSSLQSVFEQLCDPLLPVRGHGLQALSKLVEERDPETLSKKDSVQKIFQENMHHGDSYLYLAAINGMSALADRFPESVVPALAEEFAGFSKQNSATAGSGRPKIPSDHRLKLGEVLMKATRNLGDMVPRYRDVLLAAVMTGARDKDPAVRASSVSNLAELCHLLGFAIAPVLQEVISCCTCLLTGEDVIVRRAAALTLAKILEGLDRNALEVLESNLGELYRLLKRLEEQDTDDAVQLHANMALVQLDSIARGFLFPKQTLQKKIQILPDADTFR